MLLQKMNSSLNKLTNEVKNQTIQTNEEKSFMLIFQDIDQFYNNLNLSNETLTPIVSSSNCSVLNSTNNSCDFVTEELEEHFYNYWALILILFPIFTLFGNVLVILSVYRERTLQSATNYFIVSLAVADLLVAVVVMPFAVYVLVNGAWALPGFVCDFYIAMDVTCSTSSIFNLVAISIDRYIAVTQPIKYAKHKNNRRIWLTIALVWMISAAIGSPIVLGLNNTPERIPDACLFYNSDFIIYSSLSSFYIPCSIMVFLYYSIFKALKLRAMQSRLNRKPMAYEIKQTSNKNEISPEGRRVLAETTLGPISTIDEQATNTGSGSGEEEEEVEQDCHLISNERSTEFILATVVEEAAGNQNLNYDQVISSVVASLATPAPQADPNGNNDSGYAPSQTEVSDSPKKGVRHFFKKNGASPSSDLIRLGTKTSNASESSAGSKKDKKATSAPRFTIYKVNKASKKKREKSSAKKERKATKTLAIVLGVFLFCWMPFFTCNILDAMCSKLNLSCQPGVAAFLLTTWLGYMNSFVNPVIYTIFNPEFRKAFKKIMRIGP